MNMGKRVRKCYKTSGGNLVNAWFCVNRNIRNIQQSRPEGFQFTTRWPREYKNRKYDS